jgi:hypothetical protein
MAHPIRHLLRIRVSRADSKNDSANRHPERVRRVYVKPRGRLDLPQEF